MALTPDQIDDLVTLTENLKERDKWSDISLAYPEYVAPRMILDKKVAKQGGPQIQFQVQVKNTGNARPSGLYDKDDTAVEDVMISATVPWTMQKTSWGYDVLEPLFQSDRETIISVLKVREHDAMNSMVELQEEQLWGEPTSSTDKAPMGVPFWLRRSSTSAAGDFYGANPTATGLTGGCGNVSTTTYPKWRNWTFTYSAYTIDDLVKKIKKASWATNFQAPVPHPELGFGKSNYVIYTTYNVLDPLERLCETRNENLGGDLAKYLNSVTIGGVPIKAIPYLHYNDTTDPIYGVNWGVFRPYVLSGCWMRKTGPKPAFGQRNVREVYYDNAMNYVCVNRRKTYCGYKV
jgi:hypothetical protein